MSASLLRFAIACTERGIVPDSLQRAGIRRLARSRLREARTDDPAAAAELCASFASGMRAAAVAPLPHKANEQHYELPARFFGHVLGRHRKYSACWWPPGVATLDEAETAALAETCRRAELTDGQDVLELGCGWGALSLWIAEKYPASRVLAVSNSHSQRVFVEGEARRRNIANLRVVTADMNGFDVGGRFDRVVSVEMFEHMRNWSDLFARVRGWLRPGGRFFMHVFVHGGAPYAFEPRDESDWMSRHFFSGGMMPSDDLALRFQDPLSLLARWRWDGRHYERTANAWLANLDARRSEALPMLARCYGEVQAEQWLQRWRIFFMACAELFGFRGGQEWWVSHYLFERPAR